MLALAACGVGAGGPTGMIPTIVPGASGGTGSPASSPTTTPAAQPSPGREPGTTWTDDHGVAQAWVPGGTFRMGSDEGSATPPSWAAATFRSEHPAHEVAISRGYWIDVTEVTVAEFGAFKQAGGYDDRAAWSQEGWAWRQSMGASPLPRPCLEQLQTPDQPQVCVTWYEAEAYATWRGGRLPTEAEWELAARVPESLVYPWGNDFDASRANLDGATGPVAVGSYPTGASWVGALDMAGNAMEWVADWLAVDYYATSPKTDPTGPATGTIKVEKGGWWGSNEFVARSAYRHYEDPPTYGDRHIGFRVASQ